jgi:hypothetical protein
LLLSLGVDHAMQLLLLLLLPLLLLLQFTAVPIRGVIRTADVTVYSCYGIQQYPTPN